jgi:hypothetical protein
MPRDFAGVMHEWGSGKLHNGGSGKVVKSQKQALAIAFSEQRKKQVQRRTGAGRALLGKR